MTVAKFYFVDNKKKDYIANYQRFFFKFPEKNKYKQIKLFDIDIKYWKKMVVDSKLIDISKFFQFE